VLAAGSKNTPLSAVLEPPLGCEILVLLQAEGHEVDAGREARGELIANPLHQGFARGIGLARGELRYRRVDMLVVEPVDHHPSDPRVELAEVGDEGGLGIEPAAHRDEQPVVVAVPRQVGALAEAGPILLLAPLRSPVEMAGAEAIAALEPDGGGESRF